MGSKKTSGRLPEVFIDRLRDNTLQGLGDLVGTGGLLHAAADALHAPHRLLRGHALQQGGHALEISIAAPLGLYRPDHAVLHGIGMAAGTAVCYLFGTVWLAEQMSLTFTEALGIGVIPYLPGDAAKILLAVILGPKLRRIVRPILSR